MKTNKSMLNDLTQGNVARQLLVFAFPLMMSNLLQIGYNLVDMAIIGQFVGSTGLSGVSIGSEYLHLLTLLCTGFASAGQVMISQYAGAGNRDAIRRTIGTMFTFILSVGLVASVITVTLIDPMLRLMNTPAEAWNDARNYTMVCFCGLIFIFGYNIVSSILRGMGDSRRPFVFIAIASVTNIVLDLIFVPGLGMGAFGAALATVMGQAISFIASLIYLCRRKEAFGFDFKAASFKIDKEQLLPMIKLGFPMALHYAAVSISMMFVSASINAYGLVASAVTGVGNKLRGIFGIVTNSLCAASTSMIGQNLGAGKTDRVKKIIHTCLVVNMSAFVVISALFLLFPEGIFSCFNRDPEVLAMAPVFMQTVVVAFLSYAIMSPFNALINGLGFASLSFVIGILDGVVARIGLSFLLGYGLNMGIVGFWLGNSLAAYVTAIIGLIYYLSGRWKTRKLLIEK